MARQPIDTEAPIRASCRLRGSQPQSSDGQRSGLALLRARSPVMAPAFGDRSHVEAGGSGSGQAAQQARVPPAVYVRRLSATFVSARQGDDPDRNRPTQGFSVELEIGPQGHDEYIA
jgi:hypothetical protein